MIKTSLEGLRADLQSAIWKSRSHSARLVLCGYFWRKSTGGMLSPLRAAWSAYVVSKKHPSTAEATQQLQQYWFNLELIHWELQRHESCEDSAAADMRTNAAHLNKAVQILAAALVSSGYVTYRAK